MEFSNPNGVASVGANHFSFPFLSFPRFRNCNPNSSIQSSPIPQSIAHVVIHTVFSTKHREPFLAETALRNEMFHMLGGTVKTLDCVPITIGGHEDHVHLLNSLPRTLTLADFVKETKRITSKWMKTEKGTGGFAWQNGYGVFSVSESRIPKVKAYIAGQETHHRRQTFQDEYRGFLRRHNIPFDERYVWD